MRRFYITLLFTLFAFLGSTFIKAENQKNIVLKDSKDSLLLELRSQCFKSLGKPEFYDLIEKFQQRADSLKDRLCKVNVQEFKTYNYFILKDDKKLAEETDKLSIYLKKIFKGGVQGYNCYRYILNLYQEKDYFDKALSLVDSLIYIASKEKNLKGIAICNQHLGDLYSSQHLHNTAIECYKKAIPFLDISKDPDYTICQIYSTTSYQYFLLSNYLESFNYAEKLDSINNKLYNILGDKLNYLNIKQDALSLLLMNATKLGKRNIAQRYYKSLSSLKTNRNTSSLKDEAFLYYYNDIEDYDKALNYAKLLDKKYHDSKEQYLKIDNLRLYAELLIKTNNTDKGLALFEIYSQRLDSLLHKQSRQNINQLIIKNNVAQLKIDKYDAQIKLERSRFQLGLLLLIISCIALIINLSFHFRILKKNKQLSNANKQANKALELSKSSLKVRNDFIHHISHEIRTPLNAIVGFSQLITEGTKKEKELKEYYKIIDENTNELINIVDELIDISMSSSLIQEENNVTFNLYKELNFINENVLHLLRCNNKIILKQNYKDTINVWQKQKAFQKAFANFFKGLIYYCEKENSIIGLCYYENESLKMITTIKDFILSEKEKNHFFDLFYKLDTFRLGGGSNFYISKKIIEELKGTIVINNRNKEGLQIIITLPIKQYEE